MTVKSRQRGFTLIEVLVAIGIIAALGVIAVLGLRYASRPAKADQTRVVLETLKSMLNEYKVSGGDMNLLYAPTGYTPAPMFYNTAQSAPGNMSPANPGNRNGTLATNSRGVVQILLRTPNNKRIYEQIPKDLIEMVTVGGVNQPQILDAWRNPIIFLPPQGMSNVSLQRRGTTNTFELTGQRIVTTDFNLANPTTTGQPFFASAGEDENFQWGDDNLYSSDVKRP